MARTKQKRRKNLNGTERYIVSGPARWKRSFHTSHAAAMKAGHKCSQQFPNAICKVEVGLPGLQRVVAECNRNDCWQVNGFGKRKRRRKAQRK